jgi:hypothetical protein
MNITFFRIPKPKHFHFTPRYYDERKEAAERRKKELLSSGMDHSETGLRDKMHRRWGEEGRRSHKKSDIQRIVIFLVISAVLIFLIFFS